MSVNPSLAVNTLDQPLVGQVYPPLMPVIGDCEQPVAVPPVELVGRLIVVVLIVVAFNCSATGAKSTYPTWIWSAVVAPQKRKPSEQAGPVTGVKSMGTVNTPAAVVGHAFVIGML